jgi:hypothetical protein
MLRRSSLDFTLLKTTRFGTTSQEAVRVKGSIEELGFSLITLVRAAGGDPKKRSWGLIQAGPGNDFSYSSPEQKGGGTVHAL